MRNIGVIFILVLIGMLIWKASEQERPVQSARVASAATSLQADADVPLVRSANLNSPVLPAEKLLFQSQELIHHEADVPLVRSAGLNSPVLPDEKLRYQSQELIHQSQEDTVDSVPRVERSPVNTDKNEAAEQNLEPKDREFERIIIPSIKVNAKVVTKPYTELTWDLTNLEHDVAALDDVPTQTTDNNLVFAGHVTVRNGSHGPFRYLFRLLPGDIVILEDEDYIYTFSVRDQILVYPEESSVLNDTPNLQLTLITCTTYDEETSTYLRRRIVLADLEKVEIKDVLYD